MDDWLIWQLIDSTFPSGGFAHSGGLEAAWQNRFITDAQDLHGYLAITLKQITHGILVFGRHAWREPDRFDAADSDCDLFLNNHVANRASRAQGKALIASAAATFDCDRIKGLSTAARERRLPMHLAPVFGFMTRSLGLDEDRFVSMFQFMSIRGSLSAAVRLGIVGPLEAQRIQATFFAPSRCAQGEGSSSFDNRNSKFEILTALNPGAVQISPVLDLIQAGQDRLYSRLFQS